MLRTPASTSSPLGTTSTRFGNLSVAEHRLGVLRSWCEKEDRDFGVRQFTFGLTGPDYEVAAMLPWRDTING